MSARRSSNIFRLNVVLSYLVRDYPDRCSCERGICGRNAVKSRPNPQCAAGGNFFAATRRVAALGFEARLGEKDGYVRLHWTSTNRWSGEKRQCENRIELTTRAQPLGGRRWWFACPHTGQLAERLHLPSEAYTFACRKAYRLAYRSQRETPRDRALSGAFALRRKLGADGGIGDYVTKPKGMHWRTFERVMERIDRAEGNRPLQYARLQRNPRC